MSTIIRHEEEKPKAGLLDIIGAPISALTGIFLLFYPYVVALSILDDPSQLSGPRVVKASICILFAFIFFVPRATQTFFRSRQSWSGSFAVRFILFLVFAWICFKFMESAKYYPGALNSLKIGGYDKAYLVIFSVWAYFYLTYFVLPGQYIRLLRHRHDSRPGAESEKFEPDQRQSVSGTFLSAMTSPQSPRWSRVIGGIAVLIVVTLSVMASFSDSYPSKYALELQDKYGMYLSIYIASTLLLLLFVRKDTFGATSLKMPRGGSLIAIPMTVFFAWLTPIALFQKVLPEYFQFVGENEAASIQLVVIDTSYRRDDRFCTNGFAAVNFTNNVANPRMKICDVSDLDFETLTEGSFVLATGIETIMGFKLDRVYVSK